MVLLFAMTTLLAQTNGKQSSGKFFPLKSINDVSASEKMQVLNNWNSTKSVNTSKMQLDSVILSQFDVGTFTWVNTMKEIYEYNMDGYNTIYTSAGWDDVLSEWYDGGFTEYFYNSSNMMDSVIQTEYLSSGNTFIWKDEYLYDSNDLLETYFAYEWDEMIMAYEPMEKNEFYYDADGNDTTTVEAYWDNGSMTWMLDRMEDKIFDMNGLLLESHGFYWESGMSLWFQADQTIFSYDGDDNLTEELFQYWDEFNSTWIDVFKVVSSYTNGLVDTTTNLGWNGTDWEPYSRNTFEYDTDGDLDYNYIHEWDQGSASWVSETRIALDHDTNWAYEDLILPNTLNDDEEGLMMFSHQLIDYSLESFIVAAWIALMDVEIFWSQVELNETEELASTGIKVYPNPVVDELSIEMDDAANRYQLNIYNITGSLVDSREVSGVDRVSLNHLSNGSYLLLILSDGKVLHNQEIIKQ